MRGLRLRSDRKLGDLVLEKVENEGSVEGSAVELFYRVSVKHDAVLAYAFGELRRDMSRPAA